MNLKIFTLNDREAYELDHGDDMEEETADATQVGPTSSKKSKDPILEVFW